MVFTPEQLTIAIITSAQFTYTQGNFDLGFQAPGQIQLRSILKVHFPPLVATSSFNTHYIFSKIAREDTETVVGCHSLTNPRVDYYCLYKYEDQSLYVFGLVETEAAQPNTLVTLRLTNIISPATTEPIALKFSVLDKKYSAYYHKDGIPFTANQPKKIEEITFKKQSSSTIEKLEFKLDYTTNLPKGFKCKFQITVGDGLDLSNAVANYGATKVPEESDNSKLTFTASFCPAANIKKTYYLKGVEKTTRSKIEEQVVFKVWMATSDSIANPSEALTATITLNLIPRKIWKSSIGYNPPALLGSKSRFVFGWEAGGHVPKESYVLLKLTPYGNFPEITYTNKVPCFLEGRPPYCLRVSQDTIRVDEFIDRDYSASQTIRFDVDNLQLPYCQIQQNLRYQLEVFSATTDFLIEATRGELAWQDIKKGVLSVQKIETDGQGDASGSAQFSDKAEEMSSITFRVSHLVAILEGSVLFVKLPKWATWLPETSKSLVESGLPGAVCERVFGSKENILRISKIKATTGPGSVYFSLTNYKNPRYGGFHLFKFSLRTEGSQCEYHVGEYEAKIEGDQAPPSSSGDVDGDGSPQPRPGGRGKFGFLPNIVFSFLFAHFSVALF